MRWLVVIGLASLLGAVEARARDCAVPAERLACDTNDDCGCGVRARRCDVAARECVEPGECETYCGGRYGYLGAICRGGQCTRALPTACAGDCDADAAVGIAELMVGVGIALDMHPVSACANLDLDGDGAAEVYELLRAVRAALGGCAAAVGPFSGLSGYYDAELTTAGVGSAAVASVDETDDGLSLRIAQGPDQMLYLSGPLADGRATLIGYYLFTDVAVGISSDATVASDDGEVVIGGAIAADSPYGDAPGAFVLRRSAIESPARFSGTWTLHFNESPGGDGMPSHATLGFDIAASGVGLTGEGEDRGVNDALFGGITTGTCWVGPRGHLACSMLYLLPGPPYTTPFRLSGSLGPHGGSGSFLTGTFPPYPLEPYVYGSWTAERG